MGNNVIESKTKVMMFCKPKVTKHLKFMYNEVEPELVNNCKCLGLIINFNCSFKLAITELNKQFSRIM